MTDPFTNPLVKRHVSAAKTLLRIRDAEVNGLDDDALDSAAGHLRAIQKATGLTPQQVCDALRIHGWRRRGVLPQSGGAIRFRLRTRDRVARRMVGGSTAGGVPTHEEWVARPKHRSKIYRPREGRPNEKE